MAQLSDKESVKQEIQSLEAKLILKDDSVKLPLPPMPEVFKTAWEMGYHDGGEHDCRMFEPNAQRAWELYQWRKQNAATTIKKPLQRTQKMSQSNPQPDGRKSFQRLVDEQRRMNKARIRQQLIGRTEPFKMPKGNTTGSGKSLDAEFWEELGRFCGLMFVLGVVVFFWLSLGE